jgi:formylmethanofuran--tetrahydromethanopterin N-formyltransferase
LRINGTEISDTFAEAFTMRYTRVVVTAVDRYWLDAGLNQFCGYGTSVIGCDAEVGVDHYLDSDNSPDGRPAACVLAFAFNQESLAQAVANRCGQCLMTCPTTAVFNGLPSETTVPLGSHLRFFGDGYQKSKLVGDRRLWRIPVMDGEFLVEESVGVAKGIAGGNFLVQSVDQASGSQAARQAVEAIRDVHGVMTPFPGGVVRSGSKVGSRYGGLVASTADAWCPSLRGRVPTLVHPHANCVYEIVIDGCDELCVKSAMVQGITAASGKNSIAIAAGNYGGKLGKHQFHLKSLFDKRQPGLTI